MERKTISVQPYIDAGGQLGSRIEVNPEAEASIMKRTALRRDVLITRGDERDKVIVQGSGEVLTAAKSRATTQEASGSTRRTTDKSHIIFVNDHKISDDTDDWMRSSNKRGIDAYNKKFLTEMSRSVTKSLRKSFMQEKKDVLLTSGSNTLRISVPLGVGVAIAYIVQDFFRDNFFGFSDGDVSSREFFSLALKLGGLRLVVSAWIDFYEGKPLVARTWLKKSEYLIINPQIPSMVMGNMALSVNSNKLISFRDSQQS